MIPTVICLTERLHPTTQYAHDVVHGEMRALVCLPEYQACKRHLDDLARQSTDGFPYVFDESRADRISRWFGKCQHVRGAYAGQPIELLDWQKFDLGCFYGWVERDSGARRFDMSFEMRARGNVKSTEKSGEALYYLGGDAIYPPGKPELAAYEMMPEVECAAVDRQQARRVYGDAWQMAKSSPDIAKRLIIKKTYIEHARRGGYIRPLSRETKNKDSGAPCGVIIDEYHAHSTSEIVDVMRSSFGKRYQSALRIITTAGTNAMNSPCKQEYDIAKQILDGLIVSDRYFVMIRELDPDDDPHDEAVWVKPNPILRSETLYSRQLYRSIKEEHDLAFDSKSPSKIRDWMIRRMCVWQTDSEDKYMDARTMEIWKELAVPREEFEQLVAGIPAYVGADLSKTIDLTADADVYPLPDGRFAVRARGYMPDEGVQRHEHGDRVPYGFWAKEDWVTITPGTVTDYHFLQQRIADRFDEGGEDLAEFCFDPYSATHLAQELSARYGEEKVVAIRQGVQTLSEPTKLFRALIMQRRIVHDGSPVLTWCLSNAREDRDHNENIKLSKKNVNDSQRIDLIAAVINAFVRASVAREDENLITEEWSA